MYVRLVALQPLHYRDFLKWGSLLSIEECEGFNQSSLDGFFIHARFFLQKEEWNVVWLQFSMGFLFRMSFTPSRKNVDSWFEGLTVWQFDNAAVHFDLWRFESCCSTVPFFIICHKECAFFFFIKKNPSNSLFKIKNKKYTQNSLYRPPIAKHVLILSFSWPLALSQTYVL